MSDIKNSQFIAKFTKILNDKVDDYITQVTGKQPKKDISKTLTLRRITLPLDPTRNPYGLAYIWWLHEQALAKATIRSKISMFYVFIAPNFNLNMSLNEFILQVDKIQGIINKASIPSSKWIMVYFNMIFNWMLETGNVGSTQHLILGRKLKKRKMTRAEQQAEKRTDIAKKYLEPSEANRVIEIVGSWEK